MECKNARNAPPETELESPLIPQWAIDRVEPIPCCSQAHLDDMRLVAMDPERPATDILDYLAAHDAKVRRELLRWGLEGQNDEWVAAFDARARTELLLAPTHGS